MATGSPGRGSLLRFPVACQGVEQAVSHGKWLIVEDINMAPAEVLASLIPLLENRKLAIPQRAETLNVRDGFHLIATVTCAPVSSGVGTYGSADAIKVDPSLQAVVEPLRFVC